MILRNLYFLILLHIISDVHCESGTEITGTREHPVDLLKLKHIEINGYKHDSLNSKNLKLFKNVETLVLKNCNFTVLSENIMHAVPNLEKITIIDTVFSREKTDVSSCCKKLKEVEMINSGFLQFPWDKLEEEWPLEKIYLRREEIPSLGPHILKDIELKELTIEYSGVETIDDAAFVGLEGLEILILQGNKISTINSKMFEPLKDLKILNLSGNLLTKLTTDQFPSMPNLEKLDVSHNPIKEINLEGIKKLAPKLTTVHITGIEGVDTSKNGGVAFAN